MRSSLQGAAMAFRHRKDLDERQARGLGGRQDSRRLPRHPLRSGVFEGARCYETRRVRLLPARRAHRRLYDSARIYRMESRSTATRYDAVVERSAPTIQGLLHPAADVSRLQHARRQSSPCPVERRSSSGNGAPISARKRSRRAWTSASARGTAWRRTRSRRWPKPRPTTRTRS